MKTRKGILCDLLIYFYIFETKRNFDFSGSLNFILLHLKRRRNQQPSKMTSPRRHCCAVGISDLLDRRLDCSSRLATLRTNGHHLGPKNDWLLIFGHSCSIRSAHARKCRKPRGLDLRLIFFLFYNSRREMTIKGWCFLAKGGVHPSLTL